MGVETAVLGAAALQAFGGLQAEREGRKQGAIAESTAREEAKIRADQVQQQIGRNITLFAKSGVLLQGSPLLAIQEDIQTGVEDVAAIERQGVREGKSLRARGRQELFSSLAGGIGRAATVV